MKRKLAFIMAAIMLVTTPASVLASESMDVSVVSEDIISEDDNAEANVEETPAEGDNAEAYVEETPAEGDNAEEVTDIPEASYEESGEAEAGPEDYDVFIEDEIPAEDYAADAAETTEYGDDDFIVSIEEVPTTYSDVSLLDSSIVDSGNCGDNLTWKLDEAGTLTISGTGAMDDYSYSSGWAPWGSYYESVKSIIIEEGVTSIGDYAFSDLHYMTSDVSLPETLETIGKCAFDSCGIKTIYIPHGVSSIGKFAFDNTGLKEISYDGTIKEWAAIVYDYTSADEDALHSVTIHFLREDDDTIIMGGGCGDDLFWKLDSAGTLTIFGSGTMSYAEGAPWEWKMREIFIVIIEEGATNIANDAFFDLYYMTEIYIPETITEIGEQAFMYCSSLTDIVLPNNCNKIGRRAFQYCTALKNISFSNNIAEIGSDAFDSCTSLSDVYYNGFKSDWKEISISSGNDLLTNATIHYNTIDVSSSCTVTLSQSSYTYDGSAKKPTVTVKNGSKTLKSGTDYTVSYKNNTNAGTATATATGKGNYTGSIKKTFTINKASQTLSAKISSSSIVKGKTATITASGKGKISYSSNKKSVATVSSKGKIKAKAIGTAKITVKAAGNSNYKSASKTLTIKVKPKATTLKSAKSSSSKKLTVKWKKVSGVSGYQIQYSTNKNFKSGNKKVKVSGASKVSKTISSLKKGKTYYVRVRTYKKVSGTTYYSSWSSKKKVRIK